jgi:quercetin dioxygenase-like cupin family protein
MKGHRKRVLAATGITAIGALVAAALIVVPALATPASGETPRLLAPVGHFDEINAKTKSGDWKAEIDTKGLSAVHVVEVMIQPGGYLGWHSHPGPRFLIVKSGTATNYRADDPTCTPQVLPAGSSLFEAAGDVHDLRNEGSEPLVYVTVQLVAAGAPRRIDEPKPGNCPS